LLRLQEVDDHAAAQTAEINALRAVLRRDPELERQRGVVAEAERDQSAAAAELASAEQELAALEQRVKQLDRRLFDGSVRNPAELLEMQHELEPLRGRVGGLEEHILLLMERADAATQRALTARSTFEHLEMKRAAESGPRRKRLADLQRGLEETRRAREEALGTAGGADAALYARVASHRQPAVVSIKGDACGGCHLPLSNEERRAVRAGETIVQCSNCDRILVP
jgi:predicted  nucleic acid-binding Zn-ribbon protein